MLQRQTSFALRRLRFDPARSAACFPSSSSSTSRAISFSVHGRSLGLRHQKLDEQLKDTRKPKLPQNASFSTSTVPAFPTKNIKMWTPGHTAPTPEQLLETNQKWIADTNPELFATTAKGQKPSIFWLGCCDSRVPAELVTGAAPGDLFVHRNIANTFSSKDTSSLAALAYAVNALGITHVVVCGHYSCGGVQAAFQSAKQRNVAEPAPDEGTEAIQQWLSPIRALAVAETRAGTAGQDEVEDMRRLVEKNVCAQVSNVASSSVIRNAWKEGKKITIHGWVYDLASGKLTDLKVGEGSEI